VWQLHHDLCTQIDGVEFAHAWPRRSIHRLDQLDVPVIAVEDLIANETATGQPQDLIDVEVLQKLNAK